MYLGMVSLSLSVNVQQDLVIILLCVVLLSCCPLYNFNNTASGLALHYRQQHSQVLFLVCFDVGSHITAGLDTGHGREGKWNLFILFIYIYIYLTK